MDLDDETKVARDIELFRQQRGKREKSTTEPKMSDEWAWWQTKLRGEPAQMSEGTPHAGFYRAARRGQYGARRTFLPVAYWPGENGELNCRIGDDDVTPQHGRDIWVSVGNNPIVEETYRAVAERGEPWPDEHELVPMAGDNKPPVDDNSFEALEAAVENLAREAEQRVEGPAIADQDEADRIANLADRLAELHGRVDEARKVEKRPYDEGAAAVQKRWTPLLLKAETYRNLKFKLLTPWLKKLAADAAKRAAEAAEASGVPPPESRRPRAGTRGRAQTLKSTKRAEIVNYDECLNFFREHDDVRGAIQHLANRAVRAGITVPGTKVLEDTQAV
jgi:hypothetical protein